MDRAPASFSVQLGIPRSHPDFEGHFPEFPLLPAVSQIALIKELAEKQLGFAIDCMAVTKTKFKAMLRPDSEVQVELTFVGDSDLRWLLRDATQTYSMGVLQY